MRQVRRQARLHGDRNGDPLEGLVNLFDLGIVLAVAFLLAALTATRPGSTSSPHPTSGVSPSPGPSGSPRPLPTTTARATGPGELVGGVYQLPGGGLVYVPDSASPSAGPTAEPTAKP